MLEEAVRIGCEYLGHGTKPVFACEWESSAANILRQRMEDQALEPCPIWCGDLGKIDGRPFRGLVDILTAGLPCQPFSCAGKQAGNDDARAWGEGEGPQPNFLRLVAEIEPAVVFLENVPLWVTTGHFRRFGGELSALGYEIEEPLFIRAEDVGASHKRERVFILAHRYQRGFEGFGKSRSREQRNDFNASGSSLADSDHGFSKQSKVEIQTGRRTAIEGGGKLAEEQDNQVFSRRYFVGYGEREVDNAASSRHEGCGERAETSGCGPRMQGPDERCSELGQPESERSQGERRDNDSQGWQIENGYVDVPGRAGLFAPGPNADWSRIVANRPHLAPAIKPGFRVLVDGVAYVVDTERSAQLRATGNGVVPIQAAVAFIELIGRV